MTRRAYVLAGPTASGKSATAQILAEKHGLRILSADSMLVYQGMDIGTAKPSRAERGRVVYAGLDLASPAESFNTARYLQAVAREISGPEWEPPFLFTGGTGLYVKALLHGLDSPGKPDLHLREELGELLDRGGLAALHARLEKISPGRLDTLADPSNPRRVIRAIEMAESSAAPPQNWTKKEPIGPILGLDVPPDLLAQRIAWRVEQMFADGLLDEVRSLRLHYPIRSDTALQAIGYAEAEALMDGKISEAEAKERIAIRTRQLAKRQRTWLRNQETMEWFPLHSYSENKWADEVWYRLSARPPHVLHLPFS